MTVRREIRQQASGGVLSELTPLPRSPRQRQTTVVTIPQIECTGVLPESLCDVTSGLMVSLSVLSPPPAPPLPKVRDSCRLIFRILSISGGREGGGGCDAEGGGAASLETAPGQVEGNHVRTKTLLVVGGECLSWRMTVSVKASVDTPIHIRPCPAAIVNSNYNVITQSNSTWRGTF